jgi:hypothetical protein
MHVATIRYAAWLSLALGLMMADAVAAPVGTGFTYQGELKVSGTPANAAFDFEFALFDVATGDVALAHAGARGHSGQRGPVYPRARLHRGAVRAGRAYWLEVRVRDGASTGLFETLLPRQKITPAPYALNARTVQPGGVNQDALATGAVGASPAAGERGRDARESATRP